MSTIYVMEHHDQLLRLWQTQQASSLRILHLDFHCDMRGLLVDRPRQTAFSIFDINPAVGQGNFITHAILEGRVQQVRWVHDEPGGRQHDVGTVKYESDLTAQPYRWLLALKKQRGIPIQYQVIPYRQWTGLAEGEVFDIDWDFFAATEYPIDTVQRRVDSFLARNFNQSPRQIYLCYSPDYSHPTRTQFENFVDDLAKLFKAKVERLKTDSQQPAPKPIYKKVLPAPLMRLARTLYYNINLQFRKRGIY